MNVILKIYQMFQQKQAMFLKEEFTFVLMAYTLNEFGHQWDIKNNAWVTVNNDFWVTSEAICQWFSRVTKSRVKIIGKSPHEWPENRYSR